MGIKNFLTRGVFVTKDNEGGGESLICNHILYSIQKQNGSWKKERKGSPPPLGAKGPGRFDNVKDQFHEGGAKGPRGDQVHEQNNQISNPNVPIHGFVILTRGWPHMM